MKKSLLLSLLLCISLASCGQQDSALTISDVWVRATQPGQEVAAAYLTLRSKQDASLIKIESAEAGNVEIHEMSMTDGIMKMRMLDSVKLEKDKDFKLQSGGTHIMLFDIKKPFKTGEQIHLKLYVKDSAGKTSSYLVSAPVLNSPPT